MFRLGKFAHTVVWSFAQRPSAFQAVLHPSKFRLPWSACCERAHLDHLGRLD